MSIQPDRFSQLLLVEDDACVRCLCSWVPPIIRVVMAKSGGNAVGDWLETVDRLRVERLEEDA